MKTRRNADFIPTGIMSELNFILLCRPGESFGHVVLLCCLTVLFGFALSQIRPLHTKACPGKL